MHVPGSGSLVGRGWGPSSCRARGVTVTGAGGTEHGMWKFPWTPLLRFGIQPLYLFSSISAFIFFSHADTSSGAHQAENPFIFLLLLKFKEGNPDLVPAQPFT